MKLNLTAVLTILASSCGEMLPLIDTMSPWACTEPRLGIAYDIKYYNGTVSCGNMLLESDIGGSHPWVPPKVTFPTAEDNTFYTIIYIDPWVNMPNNGTYPDVLSPGSKAPARHWVVGNVDSEMLRAGHLAGATVVSAYKGPSPPWGSHPYHQLLYKQNHGREEFETLPSPTGIYNWDYKSFIVKHHLAGPVASNFHMTQHMNPRPEVLEITPENRIASDQLPMKCSDPPLHVAYNISYYSGEVACGNLLLESDIGGTHPWIEPKVTFAAASEGTYYTLMYIDPWVNMPDNGSWPDVTTPGSKAPARHWVVSNLDAKMLKSGDFGGATTVSAYKGPSPPWGSHPYGQYLYKQRDGRQEFEKLPSPMGIYNWDYKGFIAKYKLDGPVAMNYHVTQHMDPRSVLATFV